MLSRILYRFIVIIGNIAYYGKRNNRGGNSFGGDVESGSPSCTENGNWIEGGSGSIFSNNTTV